MARRWALPLAIGVILGAAGVHGLHAQTQAIKRTPLTKADLTGVEGKEVFVTLIEAQPGAEFPAHIHYGDEFLYVIEGSLDGFIEQAQVPAKAGETFHAPREKVHGGKVVSAGPAKLLAVHVVDKGKPLTEPANKR
jgi:quercetin dioxygenase-like cupin family protein